MAKKHTHDHDEHCEPHDVSEQVLEKMKNSGLRLTQARLKIIQVLSNSKFALAPIELFNVLNEKFKDENFDRVTVYRILEKFEELEIVHPVGNGKYVYCAHQLCDHDRHFILICDNCHSVTEVGSKSKATHMLSDLLMKEAEFKMTNKPIVIRGLCRSCS